MPVVRRLKTQTEAYWRDEFQITPDDLDVVSGVILDAGEPVSLGALATAVISRRLDNERTSVASQAASGDLYQPKNTYDVGQTLVFSALDHTTAEVIGVREGQNPKYGAFQVIRVAFEDGSEREYAAACDIPHPLNRPAEELMLGGDPDLSDAEVIAAYDAYVGSGLLAVLDTSEDYVRFSDRWFLKELLPEINVGHMNLAEAAIYLSARPMSSEEILNQVSLDVAASEEALLFAMNRALANDDRFDNVGAPEDPLWYLLSLEPSAIKDPPTILENGIRATGGEYVGLTQLEMIEDIGDELDEIPSGESTSPDRFDFELTFPYLYTGTMPACTALLESLAAPDALYFPVEIMDASKHETFQAWVVPGKRYICGLDDWYDAVNARVGARIQVRRTDDDAPITLSVTREKERRNEWVRTVQLEDDDFGLQLRPPHQQQRAAETDVNMVVDVPEADALAAYMTRDEMRELSIGQLVRAAFHHLAGLTGSGYAHAKSVYAVANTIRRTGAAPVFSELTTQACFDPIGQGLWAYDHALDGQVYATPEDMLNRPLSTRDNVVKDQAVPYTGR